MSKPSGFIVVYDDGQGLCCPFGWDDDCEGAICHAPKGPAVMFQSRDAARTAIRISKRFAALRKEQGLSVNDDFLGSSEHIKIMPLTEAGE